MARVVLGATLLLPAFSLVGAGSALAAAAPGTLSYTGCIAESGGDLCGTTDPGLSKPYTLTLSPDGSSLYVGAIGKNSLTTLSRNAQGQIGFVSCLGYTVGVDPGCTGTTDFTDAYAVAVSPDGANLYALDNGALNIFVRSASGALSYSGCVADADAGATCATAVPGSSLDHSNIPGDIVISPDGRFVYTATTAGGGNNGAVSVFRRGAGGALTPLGCIGNSTGSGQGCASLAPGLLSAGSLALSPSGYLFVGAYFGITSFKVASDGTLSDVGCIGSAAGCTPSSVVGGSGYSPHGIALSPDGTTLYAAARASHDLVQLTVNGGALSQVSCFGATGVVGCGQDLPQFGCPNALGVSSDGLDVYVTDACTYTLLTFSRSSSGSLSYSNCLAENGSTASCASDVSGLDGPTDLVITPDDSQVLVTAYAGDSVAAYARALVPPTISVTSPVDGASYTQGATVDASFACGSVAGGAVAKGCVGSVANGLPIDTSTPGAHSFTVTATDAGGTQTMRSVSYTVVAPKVSPSTLTVTGFKQSKRRWYEPRARGRHARAAGTVFTFRLNINAAVTLTFTQRGRHHRTKTVGRLTRSAKAGVNRVAFRGAFGHRRLKPGVYLVRISASGSGSRTTAGPLRFTILR